MNNLVISLEELASEKSSIIFDTSAILKPLGKGREYFDSRELREQADFTEKNNNFLYELRNYVLNRNNFFITSCVMKELCNMGHYTYMKAIRKTGGLQNKDLLRLRRKMNEEQQEQRRIINAFNDNNRVILLEENIKSKYDKLFQEYSGLIKQHSLSKPNFDFLITGIAFSMASNPVLFVSNDYNIFHARNKILKDKGLKESDIRFFTRNDFLKFKLLYYFYPKSSKIEQLSGSS